jgi:hypothetical protein
MLNVALVGLLAGSLAIGAPDGGDDKKTPHADKPAPETTVQPGVSVFDAPARDAEEPRSITQDTYALGFPSDMVPLRLWVSYALGVAEDSWDTSGDEANLSIGGASGGDLVSQRINAGAQVNVINFPMFKLGAGAVLSVAHNEYQAGEDAGDVDQFGLFPEGEDSIESGYGLQQVKVFGVARGRVLGVHGGYIFDLGQEREFEGVAVPELGGQRLPSELSTSDGRDAVFFGADFDVPSERFRVFGGLDYYILQGIEDDERTLLVNEDLYNDDDFLNFLLGLGVKFSVVEVGAAFQIQTRLNNPIVLDVGGTNDIGGHAGTVAPYIRFSPPQLPASLFIKGAVQEEYTEFGYAIGGANSVKPRIGFTAGLSVGFE